MRHPGQTWVSCWNELLQNSARSVSATSARRFRTAVGHFKISRGNVLTSARTHRYSEIGYVLMICRQQFSSTEAFVSMNIALEASQAYRRAPLTRRCDVRSSVTMLGTCKQYYNWVGHRPRAPTFVKMPPLYALKSPPSPYRLQCQCSAVRPQHPATKSSKELYS